LEGVPPHEARASDAAVTAEVFRQLDGLGPRARVVHLLRDGRITDRPGSDSFPFVLSPVGSRAVLLPEGTSIPEPEGPSIPGFSSSAQPVACSVADFLKGEATSPEPVFCRPERHLDNVVEDIATATTTELQNSFKGEDDAASRFFSGIEGNCTVVVPFSGCCKLGQVDLAKTEVEKRGHRRLQFFGQIEAALREQLAQLVQVADPNFARFFSVDSVMVEGVLDVSISSPEPVAYEEGGPLAPPSRGLVVALTMPPQGDLVPIRWNGAGGC